MFGAQNVEPFERKSATGSAALVLAGSQLLQFLAIPRNLKPVTLDREAELVTDLILDLGDFVALELDNFVTVLANNMIVVGMFGVVWIVKLVIFAEIHLSHQAALGEQRQSPVNGGTRNRAILGTRPFKKLFGCEMFSCAKHGFDDHLPLGRYPQVFPFQKFDKFLFGGFFVHHRHETSIFQPMRKSTHP